MTSLNVYALRWLEFSSKLTQLLQQFFRLRTTKKKQKMSVTRNKLVIKTEDVETTPDSPQSED